MHREQKPDEAYSKYLVGTWARRQSTAAGEVDGLGRFPFAHAKIAAPN